MFLLLSIVLLEIYTLQKTAFRNSNFFGFYGTLKFAEMGLGLATMMMRYDISLSPIFSVPIHPIDTKFGTHIPCMIPDNALFF